MDNQEKYIIEDKQYFKEAILEIIQLFKNKKFPIEKTKHVATHPNGEKNIAYYNPETDIITQYNCVSDANPNGTSILTYKLHN